MCGIAAIYSPTRPISESETKWLSEALSHRGPDDAGSYQSAGVVLLHRRLSIVDLVSGHQPIQNEAGDVTAVVNGELYDYQKLRESLECHGHRFMTDSDSELLVHLYEEHGTDCLRHLRGEFAFIIWDEKQRMIFAARDRFGIKPLVFAEWNGAIYFASEPETLFSLDFPARWNRMALAAAFRIQYHADSDTLYEGIQSIRPGHYVTVRQNCKVESHCYWDLSTDLEDESLSAEEAVELFRHIFQESVRVRLQSDVPVSALVSGGIDSCAVAATAAPFLDKPLTCFTVGFDDPGYDESALAAELCKAVGAQHHLVEVSRKMVLEHFADAVIASGGFAVNGHVPAKYLLTKAIRDAGFKVVLSGEGSDELLAGYPHFRQDLAQQGTLSLQADQIRCDNAASRGLMVAGEGNTLSASVLAGIPDPVPMFLRAKAALGSRIAELCHTGWESDLPFQSSEFFETRVAASEHSFRSPLGRASYYWTKLALGTYILRGIGDRLEMAHSVEGRLPFLDHKLYAVANKFPIGALFKDGLEKMPLRSAMAGTVPDSIRLRHKHPFLAPPVLCSRAIDARDYCAQWLAPENLGSLPFIDGRRISAFIDRLPKMDDAQRQLWDPVILFISSAAILGKHHRLSI